MKLSNEAKVGLMVTFSAVLLAVLTVRAGNIKFSNKGYELGVQFQNVDGISVNSPVMFNGLEVGRVKDIILRERQQGAVLELSVWLREDVKVRRGAQAFVKNMGFMGEKYVSITGGDPGTEALSPGELIVGKEPADLDKVLREGQDIVKEVKSIAGNINERLTKNADAVDRIFVSLDTTMSHAAAISKVIDSRLQTNAQRIDGIMAHLQSSSENIDLFTADLYANPWKLLYRPKSQKRKHDRELKEMK